MRIALALLALCTMATAVESQRVVLITAYGPFQGRGVNGSETVARGLDGVEIAGAVIRVRVLPVRWGEPEARVPAAIDELAPVLVVGLGEGHPDRVAVERTARNQAQHPDEAGTAPPATLQVLGPAERAATLLFDPAWCADATVPVVASDDAGAYLCNNLLYVALASAVPRVGFIHLPPQGGTTDDAYRAALTPIVRAIIERNLAAE
ncbi:MAG TPA: hypothetical protein VEL07_12875 [Planctomycetota bacterium]|nr:hypothetical protein [Planctomycetota bacterium]